MSHFPTPSPKPSIAFNEILNSSDSRLKGKQLPTPFDDEISLFSIFSTATTKKEFPLDSSAIIENDRMGLTFRQFVDMNRRIAKILGAYVAQVNRNLNPQAQNFQEAPSNSFGDVVIGILTDGGKHQLDERMLVYIFAILKLGATYVHIQKEQFKSNDDWKLFVRKVQPLLIVQCDTTTTNDSIIMHCFEPTRVIHQVNTDTGKCKLPLPYFILKSTELWNEAVQQTAPSGKDGGDGDVTSLKLKTSLGQRTAMIYPHFMAGSGVRWTRIGHRIIHNRIHWEKVEFPVQEDEQFYVTYPISDPRALVQICVALCVGKPIHILDPSLFHDDQLFTDPVGQEDNNNHLLQNDKLLQKIAALGLYRLSISTQNLERLLDFVHNSEESFDISSIRFWIVSGDNFTMKLGKKFFNAIHHKNCVLAILYGLPEVVWAATWVCYSNIKEMKRKSIDGRLCMGVPIYNLLISIIDDKNWKECGSGGKGEIFISTVGMGSAPSINFIQTGDLGRIVKDRGLSKVLVLDGKTNSRVKVKGFTIDLHDLGLTIQKDNANIDECVVFVSPRTKDVQTVVVAYVPKPNFTSEKKASLEKSIKKVEPLVNCFLQVETIPHLPNGQVDFRTLRKLYHEYLISCGSSDWSTLLQDYGPISNFENMDCAKILCKSIATSVGRQVPHIAKMLNDSFSSVVKILGDNNNMDKDSEAIQAVRTVHAVQSQGHVLTPEDFIGSTSLKDVIGRIKLAKKKDHVWKQEIEATKNFVKYQPLKMEHWNDVISLLKADFDSKANMFSAGSLERYWKRALDDIMKMGLSIVAFFENTMVGCALNCCSIPRSEYVPVGMNKIFGLIQTAMDSSKAETMTRSEGNLLQSFYIAVNPQVFNNECWKVVVVRDLLEESVKLGQLQGKKFGSYLVCTANPLIQEVATCLLNYRPLLELPMNRYKTSNFEKPFWDKDDHEKIGVYFTPIINKNNKARPSSVSTKRRAITART